MARAHVSPTLHVLLAGGGTGGHVFPALTVAEELRSRGHQVSFAGAPHGLEARLVPAHGVDFHPLPARPVVGQGLWGKARAAATLATSALRGRALCRRLGADVVLGTGGYASAPAVLGARLAGRPVMLLEPNAHAGVANRMLSRWSSEAAVAYARTVPELRCPARVTGAPVRSRFFKLAPMADPREAPAGLEVLILGGSQGSAQLNRAVPRALARIAPALGKLSVGKVRVLHQCGAAHAAATEEAYRRALTETGSEVDTEQPPTIEVTPFLEDVAGAMERAHLLISRAGAMTLAEICAAGRPSVLIPLAAALAHQMDNARTLESAGAARVLDGATLDDEVLAETLLGLLADPDQLMTMASAARSLARPEASSDIADRLEALAGLQGSASHEGPGEAS
ncbi:MAG: undecaprenyldiphospho-muramoylpentapeptide beta-N-acetylglucosaminyltransferase [Acidobacteriota bacterium]|nr:undecaprenyldiphospho-muramoylpentapeptide beta-N-acetylglucosaminyltransferase [Acidobacteriota bacterium]